MNVPNMKKQVQGVILGSLLMLTVLLVSCEVDFSPNAEYKETPMVYCLLDQDDDTTWVRVERCFLEEGNIYNYGSDASLTNYPEGTIKVDLLAYRNGHLDSTIALSDTLRLRDEGNFAGGLQPMFYTTARLDSTCHYKLEVRHTDNDSLVAYTDSIPLIMKNQDQLLVSPANNSRFAFTLNSACKIEWQPLVNARRYQPIIRFYYGEENAAGDGEDTLYVDLPCNSVLGATSISYSRMAFLNTLKAALIDDTNHKTYLKLVDIYITACDENMNFYMTQVNSGVGFNQTTDTYSNIYGGMGIFAARRTHLWVRRNADNSMSPMGSGSPGLYAYLVDLGIGF